MSSFLPQSIQKLIEEFSRLPGIGPKSAQRLAMYLLHSPDGRVQALAEAVSGLKMGLQFCGVCWNIAEESVCPICANPHRNQRQICVVEEILDVVALEKTLEYKGMYHVLHGALSPVNGIGPDQLKVEALVERVKREGLVERVKVEALVERVKRVEMAERVKRVEMAERVESIGGGGMCGGGMCGDGEAAIGGPAGGAEGAGLPGEARTASDLEIILATNPGMEGETTAMYLMRLLKPLGVRVTRIARGLPVGGDLDYADELTLTKAMQGRAEYI